MWFSLSVVEHSVGYIAWIVCFCSKVVSLGDTITRHLLGNLGRIGFGVWRRLGLHFKREFTVLFLPECPHIYSHRFCIRWWFSFVKRWNTATFMNFGLRKMMLSPHVWPPEPSLLSRLPQPFMNWLQSFRPPMLFKKNKFGNFETTDISDKYQLHLPRLRNKSPG